MQKLVYGRKAILCFVHADFSFGQLDRSIELAALPRILDLPVVLQIELRECQIAPSGDSSLRCRLLLGNYRNCAHVATIARQ